MTLSVQGREMRWGVQVPLALGAWMWRGCVGARTGEEVSPKLWDPQQDVWVPVLTELWARERQQVGSLPNLLLGVWDACLSPMSLTLHGQRGGVLDKATHCGPWGERMSWAAPQF